MSLDLFLNELRALKVTLAVDGEQLSVRAPKGIITKETFTALLMMALASTMLTVPMVHPKLQKHR